jgi:hypothetical protein
MILPPIWLRLDFDHWPKLWLPLFVLWPALIACFAFCAALLAVWVSLQPQLHLGHTTSIVGTTWRMLCATRGTELKIHSGTTRMSVSVL